MITDFFLGIFDAVMQFIAGLLPVHDPQLPSLSPVVDRIAEIDQLVPIAGPLTLAFALLAFAAVFVTVRLILMARHVLLP